MTDDELLDLLNSTGEKSPSFMQKLEGVAEKIVDTPITQGIIGFGDALQNIPKAAYSTITGSEYEPTKTGEGFSYELGNLAGNIAPFLIPGPHTAALPARLATATTAGGLLSPEDPLKGALTGAAFGAAGEALPYAGKAAKYVGDKLTRADYTDDLMRAIQERFEQESAEAYDVIRPAFEKFGGKKFSSRAAKEISEMSEPYVKYLTEGKKGQKSVFEEFVDNPTIDNLQNLQSTFGKVERSINPSDVAGLELKNKISNLREGMKTAVKSGLDFFEPGSAQKYDEFSKMYATGPGEFLSNKGISEIVGGETAGKSLKKIRGDLEKVAQKIDKSGIEGHYLSQLLPEVSDKMAKSDIYQGLLGSLIGGTVGDTSGALLGAFSSKLPGLSLSSYGGPVQKAIEKRLTKYYPPVRQAMTGLGATRGILPQAEDEY